MRLRELYDRVESPLTIEAVEYILSAPKDLEDEDYIRKIIQTRYLDAHWEGHAEIADCGAIPNNAKRRVQRFKDMQHAVMENRNIFGKYAVTRMYPQGPRTAEQQVNDAPHFAFALKNNRGENIDDYPTKWQYKVEQVVKGSKVHDDWAFAQYQNCHGWSIDDKSKHKIYLNANNGTGIRIAGEFMRRCEAKNEFPFLLKFAAQPIKQDDNTIFYCAT